MWDTCWANCPPKLEPLRSGLSVVYFCRRKVFWWQSCYYFGETNGKEAECVPSLHSTATSESTLLFVCKYVRFKKRTTFGSLYWHRSLMLIQLQIVSCTASRFGLGPFPDPIEHTLWESDSLRLARHYRLAGVGWEHQTCKSAGNIALLKLFVLKYQICDICVIYKKISKGSITRPLLHTWVILSTGYQSLSRKYNSLQLHWD